MENTDWSALGFDYRKTDYNVRYSFADGKWSDMVVTDDEYIQMHMSASCLHYGIELFEGLKAFRGVDGKVRLFRVADNARRLQSSAKRLCLPVPSIEMIVDACIEVVKRNERFVPPYGTGASLYLRPVMFGTTVGLGVKPAREALLIVYCSPVGAYFKSGIKPIRVAIDREQDRAAPRGTGDVKVGGNYAASLLSGEKGHEMGYSNIMYLDAAEHKYIEECGAANFFGIKDGKYITPKSPSVLPSITNMSLRQIARDRVWLSRSVIFRSRSWNLSRSAALAERQRLSPLSDIFTICRPKNRMITATRLERTVWNSTRACRIFSMVARRINTTGVRLCCKIEKY